MEVLDISAPEITIRYMTLYNKVMDLPSKLLSLFNIKRKFKRQVIFENLNINCDSLVIETLRIPQEVEFVFGSSCKVNTASTLVKRHIIKPREEI